MQSKLSPVLLCVATLCSGCVFVSGNVNPFARSQQPLEEHVLSGSGSDRIVLVDVSGEITSQPSGNAFGIVVRESTLSKVEGALDMAAEDDRVRALVLRINSPGGSVTASDILYNEIRSFRQSTRVPVVADIHDVGASGAYYAALAADEIVAHPTSVVGSIGVLLQSVSVSGLMKKIGVSNQTITTGAMKDAGAPLDEMSSEERAMLQSVVDDMYDRFVQLVRENRKNLTDEMDQQMRDGRIFSAQQALAGGLVDRIEYLDETIERLKRKLALTEASVVIYRQPDEPVRGLYSQAGPSPMQVNLLNMGDSLAPSTPQFLYRWLP